MATIHELRPEAGSHPHDRKIESEPGWFRRHSKLVAAGGAASLLAAGIAVGVTANNSDDEPGTRPRGNTLAPPTIVTTSSTEVSSSPTPTDLPTTTHTNDNEIAPTATASETAEATSGLSNEQILALPLEAFAGLPQGDKDRLLVQEFIPRGLDNSYSFRLTDPETGAVDRTLQYLHPLTANANNTPQEILDHYAWLTHLAYAQGTPSHDPTNTVSETYTPDEVNRGIKAAFAGPIMDVTIDSTYAKDTVPEIQSLEGKPYGHFSPNTFVVIAAEPLRTGKDGKVSRIITFAVAGKEDQARYRATFYLESVPGGQVWRRGPGITSSVVE